MSKRNDPAVKILAIRAAAGNTCENCPTCTRPAASPFRRLVEGKLVAGCVDAAHNGHLYGESQAWHTRPAAVAIRAAELAHLKSLAQAKGNGSDDVARLAAGL